jgi:isocitrate dehydrogenase
MSLSVECNRRIRYTARKRRKTKGGGWVTRGSYEIAVLPGDGIGSEVMNAALAVLRKAAENQHLALSFSSY